MRSRHIRRSRALSRSVQLGQLYDDEAQNWWPNRSRAFPTQDGLRKMTYAHVQANYPTAGHIHSLRGSLEPVKFQRPRLSIWGDRRRTAVPFFDE
jgi:hypothetical protein